jgi:prevent-host-death family protein
MRKFAATTARTHLYRLLRDVQQGESILIVRRGKVVARIIPEPQMDTGKSQPTTAPIRDDQVEGAG